MHPIEDAYFHQSHLKRKQDYDHQAVAVMLSCYGIVLNYAFVLHNINLGNGFIVQYKSIVQDNAIARKHNSNCLMVIILFSVLWMIP